MLYVTKNFEMGFRQNWREGEMNAAEKGHSSLSQPLLVQGGFKWKKSLGLGLGPKTAEIDIHNFILLTSTNLSKECK